MHTPITPERLAPLEESAKSITSSGDAEGEPHLTPFRPSERTDKTDDARVEIKAPNPFLSKSMKGSFSKSLTMLEVVKEDLKMKKAMEVVHANMALGLSGKNISSTAPRAPRSAGVLTQSSKDASKPDEITPTVALHTGSNGVEGEPHLTPFKPPEPIAKTDNVKPPNPFLTKSMRGSFSKSLSLLEVVKEDKDKDKSSGAKTVNDASVKTPRTRSAPPVGVLNESQNELNKEDDDNNPIAMLSRLPSNSVLLQSSKEPRKMLKSK